MSEAELQARIIALCNELGLLVFHSGYARHDTGPGWPDLVIVSRSGNGVIFAELKGYRGDLSQQQVGWKWALRANGQSWRLWRPQDWPEIEDELRGMSDR